MHCAIIGQISTKAHGYKPNTISSGLNLNSQKYDVFMRLRHCIGLEP